MTRFSLYFLEMPHSMPLFKVGWFFGNHAMFLFLLADDHFYIFTLLGAIKPKKDYVKQRRKSSLNPTVESKYFTLLNVAITILSHIYCLVQLKYHKI